MPKRKQLQKEIDKAKEDWQNAQRETGFVPEPYIGIMPSETDVMTEKTRHLIISLMYLRIKSRIELLIKLMQKENDRIKKRRPC